MYIREVKRKIYDKIVRQISENSKSEPLSRIYSLELNFNHDNYILKIFADTSNKLVALEAFKYYYNTNLHQHEYAQVRKNSVLSAMIEILLNQYLTAN